VLAARIDPGQEYQLLEIEGVVEDVEPVPASEAHAEQADELAG
jgi:hypothetical protein